MVNSSLYFNLMLKDIEAKSSQIASNNDLLYYYTQYGRLNDAELKTYNTNVKNTMANIQQSTDGIYNIYVLGKNGMPIYTTLDEPKSMHTRYSAHRKMSPNGMRQPNRPAEEKRHGWAIIWPG